MFLTRASGLKETSDIRESPLKNGLGSFACLLFQTMTKISLKHFPAQRRHFPHRSFMQLLILLQNECVIAGLLSYLCISPSGYLTIFLEIFILFCFHVFRCQISVLRPSYLTCLDNPNYRETESSTYQRFCVRLHKRHSLVLVAVDVNNFASFLVRSVMFSHGYVNSVLDNWFLFDCGFL